MKCFGTNAPFDRFYGVPHFGAVLCSEYASEEYRALSNYYLGYFWCFHKNPLCNTDLAISYLKDAHDNPFLPLREKEKSEVHIIALYNKSDRPDYSTILEFSDNILNRTTSSSAERNIALTHQISLYSQGLGVPKDLNKAITIADQLLADDNATPSQSVNARYLKANVDLLRANASCSDFSSVNREFVELQINPNLKFLPKLSLNNTLLIASERMKITDLEVLKRAHKFIEISLKIRNIDPLQLNMARFALGKSYFQSLSGETNFVRSRELFNLVEDRYLNPAVVSIKNFYLGTLNYAFLCPTQDEPLAREIFEKCVVDPELCSFLKDTAKLNLFAMLNEGMGGPVDKPRALEYIHEVAKSPFLGEQAKTIISMLEKEDEMSNAE